MIAPSEKHLEDWIVANPQRLFSDVPCLGGRRIVAQQYTLSSGIVDLIAASILGLDIIELKKDTVSPRAVAQVMRYASEIGTIYDHMLCSTDKYGDKPISSNHKHRMRLPFVGVLIGHDFTPDTLKACLTTNIFAIEYEFDGIDYQFEEITSDIALTFNHDETDLGYALREVMRHRSLFVDGDIETLKQIYQQEGTVK